MVAAISSRTRLSDEGKDPTMKPNKRQKHSHDTRPNGLPEAMTNGTDLVAKLMGRWTERDKKYNESRAVVKSGTLNGDVDMTDGKADVVEISSDDSSEEDSGEDAEDEEDELHKEEQEAEKIKAKQAQQWKEEQIAAGIERQKAYEERRKAREAEEDEDDDAAPSFGEIVAREYPDETINVEAVFNGNNAPEPLLHAQGAQLATSSVPNAVTLTAVLNQALNTNDRDLLEEALSFKDIDSIRSTIEKLPSPQIATLLQRLAERIYRRPGRAGLLMVWVQWSLVSHGGYLTSQPEVMKMLAKLKAVINERAGALIPLQGLKGRLDMLTAQLTLRKNVQSQAQRSRGADDQEAVIYVEGEDEDSSEEADSDDEDGPAKLKPLAKRIQSHGLDLMDLGEPETSGDDTGMPNGVESDSDVGEEDSDEEDDLIDDEAEETDDDDGDEEESEDAFDDEPGENEELSEDDVNHISLKRSSAAPGRKGGFSRR